MSKKNNPQPQAEEREETRKLEDKKSNLKGKEFQNHKLQDSKRVRSTK